MFTGYFFSPAKVNIFFRVLNKQRDGYHSIASLYCAINWGDHLRITPSSQDAFLCDPIDILPFTQDNLIWKAVTLFREETALFYPLAIELVKRIPMGAGLGGGSSNAATTLWALNELYERPLSLDQLIRIAAQIGSDVAFFFSSGLAYCTGRGEIFQDLSHESFSAESALAFWIAHPQTLMLSTPKVYGNCHPHECSSRDPLLILQDWQQGGEPAINDLEPAAMRVEPALSPFKKSLIDLGFRSTVMTGSGSAFICYGGPEAPSLPTTTFMPVNALFRETESWY